MHPYELMYIIKPDMADEAREALIARFSGLISGAGGTVDKSDEWGKRRLAYPIQFLSEGYYLLVNFTAPAELIRELERNMRISEDVLRFLVTRTDT